MRSYVKKALRVLFLFFLIRPLLPILAPFTLGLGLAFGAQYPIRRLQTGLGMQTRAAVWLGTTAFLLGLGLLLAGLFWLGFAGLSRLFAVLPDMAAMAEAGLATLRQRLLQAAQHLPAGQLLADWLAEVSMDTAPTLPTLLELTGQLLRPLPDAGLWLLTAVLSAYLFAASLPDFQSSFWQQLSPKARTRLHGQLSRLKAAACGWLLCQVKLTGIVFLLLAISFWLLRIPYGLGWACGIGLLDALPLLGSGVILLPWSLICALQGDAFQAVGLVCVFLTVSSVRSLLEPRLLGAQTGVPPLVTLLAMYGGCRLAGFWGLLLGPLAAVCLAAIWQQ